MASTADGFATPFPNFHIMQPNIQTFRDHNAKMLFNCNGNVRGGDMTELRCYLVNKLMWNADADVDSLTNTFLTGYYGAAAPYIDQYLKLMQGALLGSRIPLWIYDSPATHKDGMLNPILRRTYNQLFDKAEESVKGDSALLARVQRSRLSLQYSELEIERTMPNKNVDRLKNMLDTFEDTSSPIWPCLYQRTQQFTQRVCGSLPFALPASQREKPCRGCRDHILDTAACPL